MLSSHAANIVDSSDAELEAYFVMMAVLDQTWVVNETNVGG